MTTIVQAAFTAANGTSLDAYTPDVDLVGDGFVENSGQIEIQSNRAQPASGSTTVLASIETNEADIVIDVTIQYNNVSARVGVMLRYTDTNNYWIVRIKPDGSHFSIWEMNAGVFTERDYELFSPTQGVDYALHVEAVGSTITATIDGGYEISYSSATHNQTETRHGLYGYTSACEWDDLSIETLGGTDDLDANNLTAGAVSLGTPTIGQVHGLTTTAIASGAVVLGMPIVGQIHGLAVDAMTTGVVVLSAPAIGQVHGLTAPAIAAGSPTLGLTTIGQSQVLTATALLLGNPALGVATLGQVQVLAAAGLVSGAPALNAATLGQVQVLAAAGLVSGAPVLGAAALDAAVAIYLGLVYCNLTPAATVRTNPSPVVVVDANPSPAATVYSG